MACDFGGHSLWFVSSLSQKAFRRLAAAGVSRTAKWMRRSVRDSMYYHRRSVHLVTLLPPADPLKDARQESW